MSGGDVERDAKAAVGLEARVETLLERGQWAETGRSALFEVEESALAEAEEQEKMWQDKWEAWEEESIRGPESIELTSPGPNLSLIAHWPCPLM